MKVRQIEICQIELIEIFCPNGHISIKCNNFFSISFFLLFARQTKNE